MTYISHSLESLSIVVPAHNEEQNIDALVAEIRATCLDLFQGNKLRYEVIIVDDGSTDGTGAIADSLAVLTEVKVVHHPVNRGYGAALRSGFEAATKRYVAFIDGDRQLDPRDFLRLAPHARRTQLSIGYRKRRDDPWYRRLLGKMFSRVFVPLTIGVRVRDVDCALKIIPGELIRSADLSSDGALINSELLAMAVADGYTIHEEAVGHFPRVWGEQSGANFRVIARVFWELYRVRRRVRQHVLSRPNSTPVAARSI